MLSEVTELLACPLCRSGFGLQERALVCGSGHSFDVARQGYVSLLTGSATKFPGDSAEMIAAREQFLGGGGFDALMDAVAESSAAAGVGGSTPRILEIGAGTGHYLGRVLDALPSAHGIGLDVSKFAARRIARAHPRAGAVVADVWQPLPIRDDSLTHVVCVFAPRNADEAHRVLKGRGALIVLTPTPRHLRELVALLGMVRVDDRKVERLGAAMAGRFEHADQVAVEYPMRLSHEDVRQLVGMGPSARHLTPAALADSIDELPEPFVVTASATVSTYTRIAL